MRTPTLRVLASCTTLMLGTPAALAQTAGTYTGTSADGQSVSFTLATDRNGNQAVTSATIFFNLACHSGQGTTSGGIGFGADAVVTGRQVSDTANFGYGYESFSGTFSDNDFNGKVYSSQALLFNTKGGSVPNKATICISPNQTFTTTLNATQTAARGKPMTAVEVFTAR